MVSSRRVTRANPLGVHDEVVVVVVVAGTGTLVVVETGTVVVTVVVTVVLVAGTLDAGGVVVGAVDVEDDGPVASSPAQANATKPITVAVAMTRIILISSFSGPPRRAG